MYKHIEFEKYLH